MEKKTNGSKPVHGKTSENHEQPGEFDRKITIIRRSFTRRHQHRLRVVFIGRSRHVWPIFRGVPATSFVFDNKDVAVPSADGGDRFVSAALSDPSVPLSGADDNARRLIGRQRPSGPGAGRTPASPAQPGGCARPIKTPRPDAYPTGLFTTRDNRF